MKNEHKETPQQPAPKHERGGSFAGPIIVPRTVDLGELPKGKATTGKESSDEPYFKPTGGGDGRDRGSG